MKLNLKTRLLLPNIIALLLMLIISVVVFFNINSLLYNSSKVEHTYKVIDDGNKLLMYMIDQETGMRGYSVTGEEDFLDPYKKGSSNFSSLIIQLQITVEDNPIQVGRLKEIEQQANLWKNEVAEKQINLRKNIKNGEIERNKLFNLIKSGVGKRNMDNFRNLAIRSDLSKEKQNEIIIDMINMETGLRGFLLNNKEEYLEPYNTGKIELNQKLTNQNINLSIKNAANNWMQNYSEKAIAINKKVIQTSNMKHLYKEFTKKKGKQYMDKIRGLISTFVTTEKALLKQRNDEKDSTATLTKSLLIIITLIAFILSLSIVLFITNRIMKQLGGEPEEVAQISQKIAEGDLTGNYQLNNKSTGIYRSIVNMSINLKNIVSNIRDASLQIANASEQLNIGSQNISSAANEQASSIEEVSATIEEMTSSIQQNSDNAVETEVISKSANESIILVNKQSEQSVEMNKQISEKIQIINEIAFQTNILALNAAVEAARAGEHGKGFAVVANEVRKLAERSGKAASKIVDFAQKSLEATEQTNKALVEMQPQVEKTTQLVQEITASSKEQSNGANQVNASIMQLNDITQQNASSSEEMASNAEELASQAQQLQETINFFKFENKTFLLKNKVTSTDISTSQPSNNNNKKEAVDFKIKSQIDDEGFETF